MQFNLIALLMFGLVGLNVALPAAAPDADADADAGRIHTIMIVTQLMRQQMPDPVFTQLRTSIWGLLEPGTRL